MNAYYFESELPRHSEWMTRGDYHSLFWLAPWIAFAAVLFLVFIVIWSLAWKGWALWLSARRGDKWWFVAFLLVHTLGLLEIIYIFLVAKRSEKREVKESGGSNH